MPKVGKYIDESPFVIQVNDRITIGWTRYNVERVNGDSLAVVLILRGLMSGPAISMSLPVGSKISFERIIW